MKTKMKIERAKIQDMNIILAVSESLPQSDLIDLIELFLREMRFKALLVHRENVLAGFGMQ